MLPVYKLTELFNNTPYNIGSGSFSEVYELPQHDEKVLRIVHRDPGAVEYLELAKQHQFNPYFPNIYVLVYDNRGNAVCIMEKLTPLSWDGVEDIITCPYEKEMFDVIYDCVERSRLDNVDEYLEDWYWICEHLLMDSTIDIHEENVMVRPNGEFVITDPVC